MLGVRHWCDRHGQCTPAPLLVVVCGESRPIPAPAGSLQGATRTHTYLLRCPLCVPARLQLWPAGLFRAQSFDDVCFHGLLWAAAMAPSTPDGRVLKLVLRCSYPPATQQPVPVPQPDGGGSGGEGGEEAPQHAQQEAGCEGDAAAHPQPGAAAAGRLAGPSITAQFCVHRQTPCVLHGRLHRRSTRQPCTSHACLMSWHPGRGR